MKHLKKAYIFITQNYDKHLTFKGPMKLLFIILFLIALEANCQSKITVVQKGWLVYRHNDMLAFLPIKDQAKTPTYTNFFTEEKGEGQRMNNNYSAAPKLLIAKTFLTNSYGYGKETRRYVVDGKYKFYIQPVKYVYEIENVDSDTADYCVGGWVFKINGKVTVNPVYSFVERTGEVQFLNKTDSIFAKRGGRRKTISIYPPH